MLATALAAAAQQSSAPDVKSSIDRLGNFDYATRMNAARILRRVPQSQVVPPLVQAARNHTDEFVRYRALVLVTAFNDPLTRDLMRTLLGDRNDRVREVAYRWFAGHPDPSMVPALLAALQTEQAEFVRPALVAALAALGRDPQVQRALIAEAGRGFDFFRIAVIEALGERRAVYATDVVVAAAQLDGGPIQDDAVLALGRIGGARAAEVLASIKPQGPELTASLHAAQCMLGRDCPGRIKALVDIAGNPQASSQASRAAITALGAIAVTPEPSALTTLAGLAGSPAAGIRDAVAVALSAAAVRAPVPMLAWLEELDDPAREAAYLLLRDGFARLEEDYAEEQFFAAARASYWGAAEASSSRTRIAALIDKLEF